MLTKRTLQLATYLSHKNTPKINFKRSGDPFKYFPSLSKRSCGQILCTTPSGFVSNVVHLERQRRGKPKTPAEQEQEEVRTTTTEIRTQERQRLPPPAPISFCALAAASWGSSGTWTERVISHASSLSGRCLGWVYRQVFVRYPHLVLISSVDVVTE